MRDFDFGSGGTLDFVEGLAKTAVFAVGAALLGLTLFTGDVFAFLTSGFLAAGRELLDGLALVFLAVMDGRPRGGSEISGFGNPYRSR
ncbi:MAG: hypothetical protein OEW39_01865 [Deltaproteobacteria bacterium]|nr:hypothetical protein [Deltaproteobacteria bacterium]